MPAPLQVLLIEDDNEDAHLIERAFAAHAAEYRLLRAHRLAQAEELLEREQPDLILLDLGLPDGAGITNVQRLRELARETPIVVLTGWDDAFAGKLLDAGAQQFYSKKRLRTGDLADSIRATLSRTQQSDLSSDAMQAEIGSLADSLKLLRTVHLGVIEQSALREVLAFFDRWTPTR